MDVGKAIAISALANAKKWMGAAAVTAIAHSVISVFVGCVVYMLACCCYCIRMCGAMRIAARSQ